MTNNPVLAKGLTPSAITKYLDEYVIGQDEAKKTLSVAVYAHYRKIEKSRSETIEVAKSNILLIGPTGTGKTLLCDTLSRVLKVPFVTADATSLAQTEYVNEEIEAMLQRLLDKADGDVAKAQHADQDITASNSAVKSVGDALRNGANTVDAANQSAMITSLIFKATAALQSQQ